MTSLLSIKLANAAMTQADLDLAITLITMVGATIIYTKPLQTAAGLNVVMIVEGPREAIGEILALAYVNKLGGLIELSSYD
jgi:hypothetical protein